jgi:hypothetical protein
MNWRVRIPGVGLAVILSVLWLAPGCNNIWEWSVDPDGFDAVMANGRDAFQEADYARAEELYAQAVEMRPDNAEAHYYLAKASVLNGGVDVFEIVQTLTDSEENGAEIVFGYGTNKADIVYRVNRTVLDHLEPIRSGVFSEGDFAGVDVDLDLTVAYSLRGILRLRDTNGDGRIDDQDVSLEQLGFGQNENGEFTIEGIDEIPPEDINNMIDDLEELVEGGSDVLDDILGDESSLDLDELDELLNDVGGDVTAFYVNTCTPDNPGIGDNDGDGLVDEELLNGMDDDGDSIVDEDSILEECAELP